MWKWSSSVMECCSLEQTSQRLYPEGWVGSIYTGGAPGASAELALCDILLL